MAENALNSRKYDSFKKFSSFYLKRCNEFCRKIILIFLQVEKKSFVCAIQNLSIVIILGFVAF